MRLAITGATSYTGRYLSEAFLSKSPASTVLNLSSRKTPIASHNLTNATLSQMTQAPLLFSDPAALTKSLEGADALVCTYWIRFEADGDTHAKAADRVKLLFTCAADAGVKKIVFSSHTRTSLDSPFSYIRSKAVAEQSLRELSASRSVNYSIVRPCGIFGDTPAESILMNNASYLLRRTPAFLCAGSGTDTFQPVHVRDMASLIHELAVDGVATSGEELDACGPDRPGAVELFRRLARASGAWHGGRLVLPSYVSDE